jgi:hypothetical protein
MVRLLRSSENLQPAASPRARSVRRQRWPQRRSRGHLKIQLRVSAASASVLTRSPLRFIQPTQGPSAFSSSSRLQRFFSRLNLLQELGSVT